MIVMKEANDIIGNCSLGHRIGSEDEIFGMGPESIYHLENKPLKLSANILALLLRLVCGEMNLPLRN